MERFWSKVNKTEDCWLWTAGCTGLGYGAFWIEGKQVLAHIVAYKGLRGTVAPGLILRHSCRNKHCVNPEHLTPGTHKENQADRRRDGTMNLGETHPKTFLTADQVRQIRELCAHGEQQRPVAALFGTTQATVQRIVARKVWKHI